MEEYKAEKGVIVKGMGDGQEKENIITLPAWWVA